MRLCILLSVFMFSFCEVPKKDTKHKKLELLIISGSNNHEWAKTTPQLQKMYKESGKFSTTVTESPGTLGYEDFTQFDAVVSNWNSWPENTVRWPELTENGLMQYISEGGGFVLFHGASAAFYGWDAYQELIGTTWGDSTRHGKTMPFQVVLKDKEHPITKGLGDFWITDELWVNSATQPQLNILAEAYSDPNNKGRGEMEPVALWNTRGNGRCFHNILGHNVRAMKNTGWKTLMLRGTEWAATGSVTIPVPMEINDKIHTVTGGYSWRQTDTTFALVHNDEALWQYNFKTQKGKPFFHPVRIGESSITSLSPEDHPWHLGIWHSWKFINGINYWEYDREDNAKPWNYLGVTEIRDIIFEKEADFSCKIKLQIAYHEINGPDLMTEDRTIIVSAPDANRLFYMDYQFDFTGLADEVILNRTPLPDEPEGKEHGGYAGLSVRFNQDFYAPTFINPDGSTDMKHGKKMEWKFYGLKDIKGADLGVAIFDHPGNLNYKTPWFMTDSEDHPFYYFSPSPIFYAPYVLEKSQHLKLQYRLKLYSGDVDKKELENDWDGFLKKEK